MLSRNQKVLGTAVALGAIAAGYVYYEQSQEKLSASEFSRTAVLTMLKHWDMEELKKRAHPGLYEANQEEAVRDFFKQHVGVGRIKTFEGCKGNVHLNLISGDRVTADYACHMTFENDQADIRLRLIENSPSEWEITGLAINTQSAPAGPESSCCLNLMPKE